MNKDTIEHIWTEIIHTGKGEFEYQLLSKKSIPQINIGFNKEEQRCLILELPLNYNEPFQQFDKENLSFKYFSKERCLCIILNDNFFIDLFDDLILSTYCKINQVCNPEEYSDLFVKHFIKWSAFFENKRSEGLSGDQVKGIFGELLYLKNLLIESKLNVDDILTSWRGPFDVGHDFVFDFIDYEIKTIENTKNYISISSEFQLESEKGKELELVVISVIIDVLNGISIKNIINEIKIIVLNKFGDNSIFLNALLQKGLCTNNLEEYEIYKFAILGEITYDCNKEDFPKLTRSSIPEEITKVKYDIRLNLIDEFIIQKKQF
jgi:hypothetical protein